MLIYFAVEKTLRHGGAHSGGHSRNGGGSRHAKPGSRSVHNSQARRPHVLGHGHSGGRSHRPHSGQLHRVLPHGTANNHASATNAPPVVTNAPPAVVTNAPPAVTNAPPPVVTNAPPSNTVAPNAAVNQVATQGASSPCHFVGGKLCCDTHGGQTLDLVINLHISAGSCNGCANDTNGSVLPQPAVLNQHKPTSTEKPTTTKGN
jgi:hypothetical protein